MLVFEIITVGNELLDGTVVNTNAAWLAKRISELGFVVRRYTAVGDDIGEIASAIREAIKRGADWIVLSGGLGPTFDDKTLEAVAYALGRKLELNSEALDMVRRKYESYSRETGREIKLTRERVKMATLPEGARPLPNPAGTAPGVIVEAGEVTIVALPGVPREMKAIFEESIAPVLKSKGGLKTARVVLKVAGVMESTAAPHIERVVREHRRVYVKSHPKGEERKPVLEIHLISRSGSLKEAAEEAERAAEKLRKLLEEEGGRVEVVHHHAADKQAS